MKIIIVPYEDVKDLHLQEDKIWVINFIDKETLSNNSKLFRDNAVPWTERRLLLR